MRLEDKTVTVTYKREMNHNYMIIDSPPQEPEGYECRMLAGNGIEGLLRFRLRYQEEGKAYYYEITSKQPLKRLLERKMINGGEIRALLLGIAATLERTEEYLLKEEQILLEPEYIYIEPEDFSVNLCMVPGYHSDFPASFTALLKYLLEKVDHQDKEGVVLIYNLYHESLKENYGMADLLAYLGTDGKTEGIFREETTDEEDWKRSGYDTEKEIVGPDRRSPVQEERFHAVGQGEGEISAVQKREGTLGNLAFLLMGALIGAAAGEAALWFLTGPAGVYQYGAAVGMVCAAAASLAGILSGRGQKGAAEKSVGAKVVGAKSVGAKAVRAKPDERATWNVVLEPEEEEPERNRGRGRRDDSRYGGREENVSDRDWNSGQDRQRGSRPDIGQDRQRDGRPDIGQDGQQDSRGRTWEPETTLLTECEDKPQTAVFESLSRERENIEIPYVPFIIGKHEGLVDYCLFHPTVSRIHLRVDRKEGVYIVTDLNSTNGTSVEGYRLQANETVSIANGNSVYLADAGFRFWEGR